MKLSLADLTPAALLRPANYFARPAPWFSGPVALAGVAFFMGLLQTVLALVNSAALSQAASEWARVGAISGSPETAVLYAFSPFRHLALPVYWLIFAGLAGLLRALMARLQSGSAGLAGLVLISAWAAIPYAIAGGLLQLLALLIPYSALQFSVLRLAASMLFLCLAFAGEGYVVIKALHAQRSMSGGQAALVWLAPVLLILLISGVFGLALLAM
ncbi:MAG: hypothetical protein K1X75_04055 [Leptospirales bacterium]|nr:hypothetical protein [Leptospirales bacterium]